MLKVTKEELSGYNKVDSEEMQLAIHEFSKHLTQKYTRLFIKNLKEITANGKNTDALKYRQRSLQHQRRINMEYKHEKKYNPDWHAGKPACSLSG